jgi:copper(I)-binding protein
MQESGLPERQGLKTMAARNLPWIHLVLALAVAIPPGSASAQGVQVVDAWSRPTPPGMDIGVVYFTVSNAGKSDRLLRVSSPVAKRAEVHESAMKNGVISMGSLSSVAIASGAPTSFEPSGKHVMLLGLKRPLREGDAFALVLTFANAGKIEAKVQVRGTGGADKPHSGPPAGAKH